MARAQTIQIYLPDGDPSGIRVGEITTRTVRVFDVPRPLLKRFQEMEEFNRVGVYFLFGPGEDDSPQCYIGQSGDVGQRLRQHAGPEGKEFWTRALVAVSLTNTWTTTHATYLEWQAIDRAKQFERVALGNGNNGGQPFTPAPLKADCQEFFETIAVLLTTLGQPVLDPLGTVSVQSLPENLKAHSGPSPAVPHLDPEPEPITFYLTGAKCDASAYSLPEGLLVHAGSKGRMHTVPSMHDHLLRRRQRLMEEGTVIENGDQFIFQKDFLFNSPSTAAGVLRGRSANGRIEWRDDSGRTLADVEADDA